MVEATTTRPPVTSPRSTTSRATTTTSSTPAGPTYIVVKGDTLSAVARAAGTTLTALVSANGWADGANHPIFPGDRIVLPAGANTPTTTGATTSTTVATSTTKAPPAASTSVAEQLGGYSPTGEQFGGPQQGSTPPVATPLADGTYLALDANAAGGGVDFTITQAFFGADCDANIGTGEDDCLNGFDTKGPSSTVTLAPDARVSVIYEAGGITSYRITVDELRRLVAGQAPSSDAPSEFTYIPLPFILTVRDGKATTADQRYVS